MERAIGETNRRRAIQVAYNTKHGITPKTIIKKIHDITDQLQSEHQKTVKQLLTVDRKLYDSVADLIKDKESQMAEAVKVLDFETAAIIRDEIAELIQAENPKKNRSRKNG
jgi:excinuclease ABC subunit B